jgi:hypothetical protein
LEKSTIAYEFDKDGKPTQEALKQGIKEDSTDKKVEKSDID